MVCVPLGKITVTAYQRRKDEEYSKEWSRRSRAAKSATDEYGIPFPG